MTYSPAQIARVVHEANRALQVEQADPTVSVSEHWDDLTTDYQESSIVGVLGVQEGDSPEDSHARWCRFKEAAGWTYGPVKDEAKKEHPSLVPYDDLPESQKDKDHLFAAIVKVLS